MRNIILVILLFEINYIHAQMIGDTRTTIIELNQNLPCEENSEVIMYCINGNDRLMYHFNNKGYCVMISDVKSLSLSEAKALLVKKLSLHENKPYIRDNKYTFFYENGRQKLYYIDYLEPFGYVFYETEAYPDLF